MSGEFEEFGGSEEPVELPGGASPFAEFGGAEERLVPAEAHPDDAKPAQAAEGPGFLERVGQGVLGAATGLVQGAALGARTPLDYAKAAGEYAYQNLSGTNVDWQTALDTARADTARVEAEAPIAHVGGQVAGALGTAVATGGLGTVKLGTQAAAKAGGALATRLGAAGVMTAQQASAVRLGSAVAGLVTAGAAAGAQQAVVRKVDEAITTGDYKGLAETIVPAVLEDAAKGAAIDLGLGAAGATVSHGIKKLVEAGAGDWVSGRAFKAILGITNRKGVKLADKRIPGGKEELGRSMMDEGVVTPGATFDEIAERLSQKRELIGRELGEARQELDAVAGGVDTAPDGRALWDHIEDRVLGNLRADPVKKGIGRSLEGKLADLKEHLIGDADDPVSRRLSWDDITSIRRSMDDVLKWESLSKDVGLEAYRDVRRAVNEFWMESAEKAAEQAGNPDLVKRIKTLTSRYAKLSLADDLAKEGQAARAANRFFSASDHGIGGAASVLGAITSGGSAIPALAAGAAGAAANKLARERGNQIIAGTMYGLSKRLIRTQERIQKAATLPKLLSGAAALSSAEASATAHAPAMTPLLAEQREKRVKSDLRRAEAILDPESEESRDLTGSLQALELEVGTDVAAAVRDKAMQRAQFLLEKAPPTPPPSVFDGEPKRELGEDEVNTLHRYMDAVDDPEAAIQRLGNGEATAEDLDTLGTLYPSMLQDFRRSAADTLSKMKTPPPYEERLALAETLGIALTPDTDPTAIAYWQSVAVDGAAAAQERRAQEEQTSAPRRGTKSYDPPSDQVLSTADRIA